MFPVPVDEELVVGDAFDHSILVDNVGDASNGFSAEPACPVVVADLQVRIACESERESVFLGEFAMLFDGFVVDADQDGVERLDLKDMIGKQAPLFCASPREIAGIEVQNDILLPRLIAQTKAKSVMELQFKIWCGRIYAEHGSRMSCNPGNSDTCSYSAS